MKQLNFDFWDKVINQNSLALKNAKIERRNEWIKKNLNTHKNYIEQDFYEPNIKGLL